MQGGREGGRRTCQHSPCPAPQSHRCSLQAAPLAYTILEGDWTNYAAGTRHLTGLGLISPRPGQTRPDPTRPAHGRQTNLRQDVRGLLLLSISAPTPLPLTTRHPTPPQAAPSPAKPLHTPHTTQRHLKLYQAPPSHSTPRHATPLSPSHTVKASGNGSHE
ncbi:hypothetical protein E2C01_093767 [Portunus trituberculatus]|uniref:Uncharacterized protein n=1 Tax=Portunus trituberculatus TaxID=210409 RepID=A0A5B7JZL7_PORTR|nr:hypothetical protein [Portunus trituberculatus]